MPECRKGRRDSGEMASEFALQRQRHRVGCRHSTQRARERAARMIANPGRKEGKQTARAVVGSIDVPECESGPTIKDLQYSPRHRPQKEQVWTEPADWSIHYWSGSGHSPIAGHQQQLHTLDRSHIITAAGVQIIN